MTHIELDIDTPQWLIGALTDFLGAASGDLAWSSPQSLRGSLGRGHMGRGEGGKPGSGDDGVGDRGLRLVGSRHCELDD